MTTKHDNRLIGRANWDVAEFRHNADLIRFIDTFKELAQNLDYDQEWGVCLLLVARQNGQFASFDNSQHEVNCRQSVRRVCVRQSLNWLCMDDAETTSRTRYDLRGNPAFPPSGIKGGFSAPE